jgi:hypothetical protein
VAQGVGPEFKAHTIKKKKRFKNSFGFLPNGMTSAEGGQKQGAQVIPKNGRTKQKWNWKQCERKKVQIMSSSQKASNTPQYGSLTKDFK